ncbi:MAG TPA: DUF885 domain-containing protein [Planctomycetes bacterium]|nr:DUF885 domain-containing protein [Fuerstiella sp.]HIK94278.1 DUF885 domain-containing protein [Planctomycetota bacterium]
MTSTVSRRHFFRTSVGTTTTSTTTVSHARIVLKRLLVICLLIAETTALNLAADDSPISQRNSATQALHELFDSEWQRTLRESPTHASQLGDRRYNRLWSDVSEEAIETSAAKTRAAMARLLQIDVSPLSDADRLNYQLFKREYETRIASQPLQLQFLPVNQRGGIQNQNDLARLLSFDTVTDYEDWIARLNAFPTYMDQTIALMKNGMATGMLHPKVVMKRVPTQIRKQLVKKAEDSLYYAPFRTFKVELSEAEATRLRSAAKAAIERNILPAYARFLKFFEDEYLPASFDDVGCWQRPDGQQMYAALAKKFTTTDLTPQQIHDIGLSEVARIRSEMEAIQKQVGFEGSFQEFLTHLRSAPQFFFTDPNDLLQAYKDCCQRIDPELPRLFKRIPKAAYEIIPIPAQMAPDTTTAYYQRPSADGSRPGGYYVNLYRPQDRPKYEIEALSLHESVPGHHFQIALAMELDDLPEFRRYGGYTAFIEGWGLYSEKLGEELGLYKDPYSKFGQLTYEMWRAVRLVVDTGMHSQKWSRQAAIDFFVANTAKSLLDIENEVDRYIAWPGQALAYKIGELKIRELRALAESELGARFDIKDFHDVVLRDGAVPLGVLEQNVKTWITKVH